MKVRHYLMAARQFIPKLSQEERVKVEKSLAQEKFKEKLGAELANIMKFAKLLARSYGRNVMTIEDYERSKNLLLSNLTHSE